MAGIRGDVQRLQASRDRLVQVRSRLEAAERAAAERAAAEAAGTEHAAGPGPRGELRPDREWAPRDILAHVDEMLPYWIGEMERILAGPGEPVPFGRTADDPIRTMTVDRDRTLPIPELYARLDSSVERSVRRLLELDDRQLARKGLHSRRGEMTVEEMVQFFLVAHLEEHSAQLAAALEGNAETR